GGIADLVDEHGGDGEGVAVGGCREGGGDGAGEDVVGIEDDVLGRDAIADLEGIADDGPGGQADGDGEIGGEFGGVDDAVVIGVVAEGDGGGAAVGPGGAVDDDVLGIGGGIAGEAGDGGDDGIGAIA